jgi:predicted nucleic acid-binding protein
MQKTIIDSGPLIALFDKDDKYHKLVIEFFKNFKGEFITSWAVITEVTHMLDFNLQVQLNFLKWVDMGALHLYNIEQNELKEIIRMMTKYSSVPMDLADSSLMYIAQKEGIKNIVSIDSDFDIYRTIKKQALNNLLRLNLGTQIK